MSARRCWEIEKAAVAYVEARDEYATTYDRTNARQLLDAAYLELKLAVRVGECSTESGAA